MRSTTLVLPVLLGLSACPEPVPVDENSQNQPSPVLEQGKPADGPGTQVMGAPVAAGGEGGPISAGTFGDVIPESELTPQLTQEDLAEGGVSLSGELVCGDCSGKLLVRVLPPPPEPGNTSTAAGDIQLVTVKAFDGPGPFELLVPAEGTVVLQVVDDANSDGAPSSGERMGMSEDGPVTLGAPIAGITLEVGVFPKMPEMDAMGNPLTGDVEGPANPAPPVDEPVVDDGAAPGGEAPPEGEAAPPAPEGGGGGEGG